MTDDIPPAYIVRGDRQSPTVRCDEHESLHIPVIDERDAESVMRTHIEVHHPKGASDD